MAISVVIPAYNEEKYISETVEVIKCFLSRRDFEIIVINNASTDSTALLLAETEGIRLITLSKKVTVAKARNIGWKEAKSHVIAFIDGDMIITEEWASEMQKMESSLIDMPLVITGCKCHPSRKPSWIENTWFKNENYRNNKEKYINSGNLITTKLVLDRTSGFNEELITGEDVDFCARAIKLGVVLHVNQKFKIYHEGYPKNLISFIKRERWHGVGDLASVEHFFRSKVAIFSFLITFSLVASLLLIIFKSIFFVAPLILVACMIVATAHYKFKTKDKILWIKIYALQFFYFFGRALSLTIKNKI